MADVTIRVPASAANLGPGYDAFGLALGLYNTFRAQPADTWRVEVRGEGEGRFARDGRNQVARAMARAFAEIDGAHAAARVVCDNEIPTSRGLGSSAAAIVGGVVLADALCGGVLGRDRLFGIAAEMEGHPDNVAAALFGGFTIGWSGEGAPGVAAVSPADGLAAVVVVADESLPTRTSRGLLPRQVPHADAAFNAGRSGLLAAGIALGRGDLIAAGLHDRLHEPYRVSAVPDLAEVARALVEAGALGAVLSGAGPTVIGLVSADDDDAAFEAATRIAGRVGGLDPGRRTPQALRIDRTGAAVLTG